MKLEVKLACLLSFFFVVGFSKFHMFINLNLPRHLQCYLIVCVLNLAPFWFGGATRQMRKIYDITLPYIHAYRLQIKKFLQFKCAAILLALPDKACHTQPLTLWRCHIAAVRLNVSVKEEAAR